MTLYLTPRAVRMLYSRASTDKTYSVIIMQIIGIISENISGEEEEYELLLSDGTEFTSVFCPVKSDPGCMIEREDIALHNLVQVRKFTKTWSSEDIPLVMIHNLEMVDSEECDVRGNPSELDFSTASRLAIEARNRDRVSKLEAERTKPAKDPGFTETVKFCIIALNACENGSESMEVCKILLQIIHEAEQRNPGRDYAKDVAKVANTEGSDIEKEAFLRICSYIRDIAVLPLMSSLVLRSYEYYGHSLQKTFISETVYLRRLLFVATSLKDLKHVVEIFLSFAMASHENEKKSIIVTNIYPELHNLLLKVKAHWEDEELVHATIKLLFYLIDLSSPAEQRRLLNDGAISTVTSIMSLLYAKDPELTSLERVIDYPKKSFFEQPLAKIWFDCLGTLACTDYHALDLLKEARPLVPIMCQAFGDVRSSDYLADDNGIDFVIDALSILLRSDHRDDFQQFVVRSGIMLELVKTYETYAGHYSKEDRLGNEVDPFLKAIEMFVEQCQKFAPETTQDRIDIMVVFAEILKSRLLFKEDDRYVFIDFKRHRRRTREDLKWCRGLPFVTFCFNEIMEYVAKEQNSEQFLDVFCNENYIAVMANLAERDPNLLAETTIKTISLIPLERISYETLGHKIAILYEISCQGTFDLAKEVTKELSVYDLESSAPHKIVRKILETFCVLHNKHGLHNILQKDSIMEFLPLLWKRVIHDSELRDVVDDLAQLTIDLSLLLPLHQIPEISLFESNVIVQIRKTGLSDPGVIRLAWSMVKCDKHKQLIEELSRLSSSSLFFLSSTLFFYSSEETGDENISISNIFDLLSKIIIKRLDKDPPESEEYLVKLTSCMIELAKYSSLEKERSHLEQMVSPAMFLLERVSSEVVIENIRHFVRILL